jgi:hypothetical protein
MDKSKAKKAVKKSTERKKQSKAKPKVEEQQLPIQQIGMRGIDPEIQAAQVDMQPADGYINPYRELGTMAPTQYAEGNLLPGYNRPVMVNRG